MLMISTDKTQCIQHFLHFSFCGFGFGKINIHPIVYILGITLTTETYVFCFSLLTVPKLDRPATPSYGC